VHAFKKEASVENVERKLLWEFFVVFIFIQTLKKGKGVYRRRACLLMPPLKL
jgi:hypothetical protein